LRVSVMNDFDLMLDETLEDFRLRGGRSERRREAEVFELRFVPVEERRKGVEDCVDFGRTVSEKYLSVFR